MISVLIATKNRPEEIISCIKSLLKNSYQDFEIIVIDQSTNLKTRNVLLSLRDNRIIYIQNITGGKSSTLNRGISIARGNIFAFTDDDCIVNSSWLATIERTFTQQANVDAIFGKTLPYLPNQHKDQICPCIFLNKDKKTITKLCIHYQYIGFGNNMAVRKSVFNTLGNFKQWLGPGSIGSNAEDAEFALRLLSCGKKILYSPQMVVFHNKWLTPEEMRKQNLSYACGEMACYCYFYFQNHLFAKPIVLENIHDSFQKAGRILENILLFRWKDIGMNEIHHVIAEASFRTRGLLVGLFYSLIDPIG